MTDHVNMYMQAMCLDVNKHKDLYMQEMPANVTGFKLYIQAMPINIHEIMEQKHWLKINTKTQNYNACRGQGYYES